MKRILILLLVLVLLLTVLPAARSENISQESTREESLEKMITDRFGTDATTERNDQGEIVSVNGYPFRTVQAAFNVRGMEEKFSADTDFADYPFWQPATKYNGSLANMSLILALCSARDKLRDEDPDAFDPAQNLEAYLRNAGFADIRKDDYSKETSIWTISTAMGFRRMEHEGEESFTLIAVGVCGGGYKNEWQSNITAGKGELHEGFRSASDLVIDRIAGYIATRGIKGRIKIWISGFSRAAAVANLTAGRLTHAGTFPKEDVYAYTFATPAAVLNPPKTGDENIFNILCPTDVVPQVMPAVWGYGRYGTDLWLPVPEFSSIGEAAVEEREKMIKETFGLEIHYSAALNLRMRMMISMLLEVLKDRDHYVNNIQAGVVDIMQRRNASNLLTTMRNLLLSMKNSDRETHAGMDRLLNYMFRVFGNAITRTELAAVNRNSGNELLLLFTEHREDAYLANIGFIQHGVFEDDAEFSYVMVKGPVDLELTVDELKDWSMTLTESGKVQLPNPYAYDDGQSNGFQMYYMERLNDVSVVAVPKDLGIRVRWKAVSEGTVEVLQACTGLHASVVYPGAASGKIRARAGDSGDTLLPEEREGILPEGFREEAWHAADITGFLGIDAPVFSWRIMATIIFLLAGLAVFLVIRLVSLFLPNKEKNGTAFWILLALFCVAAAEAEGAFWLLADRTVICFAWKTAAGTAALAVFFLQHRRDGNLWNSLLPGLATVIAADLVMTYFFLPGTALFLLGHVLLIISFLKKKTMRRAQWIQWAILSLITSGLIIVFIAPQMGINAWAAAVYAPVLFLMVYSASEQRSRIRHAAAFFLVSDLLLAVFAAVWPEPLAHILCMVLFSASIMLMAMREKTSRLPHTGQAASF